MRELDLYHQFSDKKLKSLVQLQRKNHMKLPRSQATQKNGIKLI